MDWARPWAAPAMLAETPEVEVGVTAPKDEEKPIPIEGRLEIEEREEVVVVAVEEIETAGEYCWSWSCWLMRA